MRQVRVRPPQVLQLTHNDHNRTIPRMAGRTRRGTPNSTGRGTCPKGMGPLLAAQARSQYAPRTPREAEFRKMAKVRAHLFRQRTFVLADRQQEQTRKPKPMAVTKELFEPVLDAVCQAFIECGYSVTREDVLGRKRNLRTVQARKTLSFILRHHYFQSCTDIGGAMGIDHSTVVYQCQSILDHLQALYDVALPYRKAMEKLGIEVPEWLPLKMEPPKHQPYRRTKIGNEAWCEENDGHVRPMNWTKEQAKTLDSWRKYG